MNDRQEALLPLLLEAMRKGDAKSVDRLKYEYLFCGPSLLDTVIDYSFLCELGVHFDFGCQIIKKGTKLFRIRKYARETDYSDPAAWSFPPHKPENRANCKGEAALYLGTSETVCLLETHAEIGEMYALGEYVVQEDIKLGGFLDCEAHTKNLSFLAGVVLNAYLIAPSRSDKNEELFRVLDEAYKGLVVGDLGADDIKKLSLPLKFGVINKRDKYYKTTNRLLKYIKTAYPDGISYSSCFIPAATIGIWCSDHNVVLYQGGMEKIQFERAEIKKNQSKITGIETLKILTVNFDRDH